MSRHVPSKAIHADHSEPRAGSAPAPVACLAAERRKRRPHDCERCARRADGLPCVPCRVEALAARLREADDPHALLIPAEDYRALHADALRVLDGITAECRAVSERTTAR